MIQDNLNNSNDQLMTVGTLAKTLDVSTRTVWRLLKQEKIPEPIRLGGNVRWRKIDIIKWVDDGCKPSEN